MLRAFSLTQKGTTLPFIRVSGRKVEGIPSGFGTVLSVPSSRITLLEGEARLERHQGSTLLYSPNPFSFHWETREGRRLEVKVIDVPIVYDIDREARRRSPLVREARS